MTRMIGFKAGSVNCREAAYLNPEMERRIVIACLAAGGLESMWCNKMFYVDRTEGESSMALVQLLNDMVRIALAESETGPAHWKQTFGALISARVN